MPATALPRLPALAAMAACCGTAAAADATGLKVELGMYAVAIGNDGYQAVVALGEIDPGFGNRGALVAYQANGSPLGNRGMARLVVDGDVKQGRSVANLAAIEVFVAPAAPALPAPL